VAGGILESNHTQGVRKEETVSTEDGILSEFLNPEQLAAELNKTPRTLKSWRVKKIGPAPTIFGKTILYRRAAVAAWLESCERKPEPIPERRTAQRRA
jgi:hypothetical protein